MRKTGPTTKHGNTTALHDNVEEKIELKKYTCKPFLKVQYGKTNVETIEKTENEAEQCKYVR